MDVALVLAVLVFLRLLIGFFGTLATSSPGSWYLGVTRALVPPLAGGWLVRSPYGGVFSVDAAIVVFILLIAEWLLARMAASLGESTGRKERALGNERT